jgi:3-hydroxyacyl-CoA dehydrogenase/3a,7a,12a-trihydroxy-5b-cholest-24-enoyl-CoA hydratase
MKLFSSGKLKISGDIMASQKLDFLKKVSPETVLAEMQKRTGGASAAPAASAPAAPAELSSADLFAAMGDHVSKNPDLSKVAKVYLFKLSSPASTWTLDLKSSAPSVSAGESAKPDCTLELSDADFLAMSTGKANPMKLFTSGKLKISGDVMASQKLEAVLKGIDPKQAQAAIAKARSGATSAAPSAAPSTAPASASSRAAEIVAALQKRFADNKGLASEIGPRVVFALSEPSGAFSITAEGAQEGSLDHPSTKFSLHEADFVALARGEKSAQSLYQHGGLRVDGDVSAAHRLGILKGLL